MTVKRIFLHPNPQSHQNPKKQTSHHWISKAISKRPSSVTNQDVLEPRTLKYCLVKRMLLLTAFRSMNSTNESKFSDQNKVSIRIIVNLNFHQNITTNRSRKTWIFVPGKYLRWNVTWLSH